MYIKKSWCVVKGKKYMTYQIVKSYRPGKGKNPRHKVIANITHLPKELIDKIDLLLKYPNARIITEFGSFFKKAYIFGSLMFFYLFMRKVGITKCLSCIPNKAKWIIIGVILNRILEPRSKLGSVGWIIRTFYPQIFGFKGVEVNEIYEAMDKVWDNMENILNNFFKMNKVGTILFLYDITSIFFEGEGPRGLSRYGYSRDEKKNNPQVILTLVLNELKLPVWFDILDGDTADKKTVIPMIIELGKRFNIRESIFIGDRGMVSSKNIEFLEEQEIKYILGLTHTGARELVYSRGIQVELFDKRVPLTIFEEEEGRVKRRYILCGSEYRRERDRIGLEHLLEKGRRALEDVKSMVEAGRIKDKEKVIRRAEKRLTESGARRFYDFKYDNGKFEIIEKKEFIERAKGLCGYYLLQTTVEDLSDREIEEHYKRLKFVEDAFRQMKELVEIRPIFHWKERRVKTHIFLCILAQMVVNKVRDRLKEVGWLGERNTLSSFIDIFSEISVGIFEIDKKEMPIITQLKSEHKRLLRLFDIDEIYFKDLTSLKKIVD